MRKKRDVLVILLVVLLVTTTALACTHPWTNARLTVDEGFLGIFKDSATSAMDRCLCNPVDNYMAAWLHIQYRSGNNYIWYPSSTSYIYDSDYDVQSVSVSTSAYNINYAEGRFVGQCKTDPETFIVLDRHVIDWVDEYNYSHPGDGYGTTTEELFE